MHLKSLRKISELFFWRFCQPINFLSESLSSGRRGVEVEDPLDAALGALGKSVGKPGGLPGLASA